MEFSPWGDGADESTTIPNRPASPALPAFSFANSTTVVAESDDWTDDGSGWGGALDYSLPSISHLSTEARSTDSGEVEKKQVREEDGGRGGWGDAAMDQEALEPVGAQHSSHFDTPSTSHTAASLESLTSPTPSDRANPPAQDDGDDWGNHGHSPTLPPIPDIGIDSVEEAFNAPRRDSGWGNESEWQPEALPPPLPSFGSSFSARSPSIREGSEMENDDLHGYNSEAAGWEGAVTQASWKGDEGDSEVLAKNVDGAWNHQTPSEPPRARSISAALVDGIKGNSRDFAKETWPVAKDTWGPDGVQERTEGINSLLSSLSLPPRFPGSSASPSTTDDDTPLSNLFRSTSTLYPAFREGLDRTALRSAETLKGTSSAAYRNARFGKNINRAPQPDGLMTSDNGFWDLESSLGTPVLPSDRGRANDEFDLDAPGAIVQGAKSSWWGASGGQNQVTNMPKSLLTKKEVEEESLGIPDPQQFAATSVSVAAATATPSAIGRFLGRFGRNPSSSPPPTVAEEGAQWSGDFSHFDQPKSSISNSQAGAPDHSDMDDDPLSNFFASTSQPPQKKAGQVLSNPSSNLSVVQKGPNRSGNIQRGLDPFDPFGDDDEVALAGSLPAVMNPRSMLGMQTSESKALPPHSTASQAPKLYAPQAQALSSILPPSSDNFGIFASSSSSNSTPNQSSPASFKTAVSPFPSFPPFDVASVPNTLRTKAPSSEASIPYSSSRSSSRLPPLLPPPPTSQFLPQKGFAISPPPPSGISVPASIKSVPSSASTGPLGIDDLSFFES